MRACVARDEGQLNRAEAPARETRRLSPLVVPLPSRRGLLEYSARTSIHMLCRRRLVLYSELILLECSLIPLLSLKEKSLCFEEDKLVGVFTRKPSWMPFLLLLVHRSQRRKRHAAVSPRRHLPFPSFSPLLAFSFPSSAFSRQV